MCENRNRVESLRLPIHKACTKRNNCCKTYVDVVSCFPFLYHLKDGEGSANTSHVKLPLPLTSISSCGGGDAVNFGTTAKKMNQIISCIVSSPTVFSLKSLRPSHNKNVYMLQGSYKTLQPFFKDFKGTFSRTTYQEYTFTNCTKMHIPSLFEQECKA